MPMHSQTDHHLSHHHHHLPPPPQLSGQGSHTRSSNVFPILSVLAFHAGSYPNARRMESALGRQGELSHQGVALSNNRMSS